MSVSGKRLGWPHPLFLQLLYALKSIQKLGWKFPAPEHKELSKQNMQGDMM
jgi:hypothetical protein